MLIVKRFKLPGLEDEKLQQAFQLLVAGVGFYEKRSPIVRGCYVVYSHEGEYIGRISAGIVNLLIHVLRANYSSCRERSDSVVCYDRLFHIKVNHLGDITFGYNKAFNPYLEGLMHKFYQNPLELSTTTQIKCAA